MKKPNIILILTDHFRRDAVGKSTPNLMALAKGGVRFTNAYCGAPLCMPSRVTLATGLFPSQTGVCGNQSAPIVIAQRDDTYMNRLQKAGYYTALIGKHHFLDRFGVGMDVRDDDEEIKQYGFDHVFQVVDDGENMHNDDEYTAYLREKGLLDEFRKVYPERAWACKEHPFEPDDTVDGFIGTQAIGWVESYDGDQPFYLNVSFVGPHPPFWHSGPLQHDPASLPDPIGNPDFTDWDKEQKAHYMDRCSVIDGYIGRLIETLEGKGLLDDTVILFTSDHGENAADFGIWDKRFCYEQSWGVPLIMAGPGVPRDERRNGDRVSKSLVSLLDLYPTILALADAEPEISRLRWGRNILRILSDEPGSGHGAVHGELGTAHFMRTGNWKIAYDPEEGGVQHLYNLVADPKELHNLAGVAGYETVTSQLLEQMLAHRIRLTQFTHVKEEQRVQRVRTV